MGYCLNTVANFISSNFDFPSAENLSILGDMLPASNEVFNLGSDDMKWKDLYLSGETIYLGKSKITNDASSGISFRDESNNAINLTVSSISIQDPSQQNKKVTLQADSDENVSNYVKSTSNDTSMRLTNIESNTSNYVENTSNSISIRITNIESNTSNYIENTSNDISLRLTNIVDTLNNNLVFSVSTNISSSETNLSIVDVFAKTRITTSGNTEFVHTFDVSISLNHNSLYHIVLFIVYNENKNFNKIDFNVMFSYYPIDDIVALNASIEFKTIKVKINYVSGNILQIIKSEPTINPIVNIISR